MSTLLRLFIPAEWPGQQIHCEWELLGKGGTRLHMGSSEPRHWPASDRLELVLSAEQALPILLPLPKSGRARTPEAVGYALEEHLLGDVSAEHFVIGHSATSTQTPTANATNTLIPTAVWVIARARLQTLIQTLRAANRVAHRIVSELQLPARTEASAWTLCLKPAPDSSFARQADEAGFVFDLLPEADATTPILPPLALRLALEEARHSGNLPEVLSLQVSPELSFDSESARLWQETLGIPVRLVGAYVWRDHRSAGEEARNFLTDDFAPPRRANEGWGAFRPALLLALLALLLYSLFSFGEWFWLARQKDQLRQQLTSQFRAAFPQAQSIVDPVLQMQRQYDQLRRERGQLGRSDFFPLLSALTEASSGQSRLRSLSYEDGRLEAVIILRDAAEAERLREILSRRGLTAILRDTKPASNGQTEATFVVRSEA